MKTSLDLPDELYRRVKSKSALQGRAVREIATALFAAWVDDRLPSELTEARSPAGEATDPRSQWLGRWRALAADVSSAVTAPVGLVDQLQRDRR